MDKLTLEKIKDLLSKNENIGIAVGRNPGVDEMAAALSLYLGLSDSGKKTTIICPTDPLVEVSSLVGVDKIKKSFEAGSAGDLTVSFPYKEGEIEKISYTLEEGKLNILVKAGENGLSFDEKSVGFSRGASAPGLVFVIGTPRLSDLGTAFDMEVLKDSKVINIDYKAENQGFGDIPLLGKNASSVSELVANFMSSLDLKIDADIAQNLMSGITHATDNFQSPTASSLSFETAANLMKKGAVREMRNSKKTSEVDSFFTPVSNGIEAKPEPKKEAAKEEVKLDENNPPDDWLAPKIYKGSSNV